MRKQRWGGAGCLILDVEGTEFPAPLAQLRIGRAKGAGNLDIQNRHVILVAELMILITSMHSKKNSFLLTTEIFRVAYTYGFT